MTYDFTTLPDRWDTGAEKYELMKARCRRISSARWPANTACCTDRKIK